ncbi:hypothetical protein BCR42DRAFT_412400 [Absidia repens]|uniref:RRM domain-containing protein n=1 Tax=Absidia repens TaxID=90262 RepID=A0A1X2IJJ5_9FUNG|nr:hypothetical protein BCR42DRAFT_412400 [Absidia repens]
MRIYPLSSSPATNPFFQTDTKLPLTDDVTTIFVVGFPDDMAEREFQNMFLFCPGFEAASLKWHCKDQEDDTSIGSNNGKKQMIGFAKFHTRLEAMEAVDIISGKKVDQDKGVVLKAEMAKKNLHVKRGSVAPIANTLLPASSATLLQQQSTLPLSTHMISGELSSSSTTTSTAMTADTTTTDSGLETSAIMVAADPTPTVTSTSSNLSTPTPISSIGGRNSVAGDGTMSLLSKKLARHPASSISSSNGSYDAFSPLPSDLLSPADYKIDPFLNDPFTTYVSTPSVPVFQDSLFRNTRSNSFDDRPPSEIGLMSPPRHRHLGGGTSSGTMIGSNQDGHGNIIRMSTAPSLATSSTSAGHTIQQQQSHRPLQQQQSYHPLQQQQQYHPYQMTPSPFKLIDDDPYDYLSKSTPVSEDRLFGTSPLFDDLMANRMGSLTMQANTLTDAARSPNVPSFQHRPSNPTDQNPLATHYELRQLFSPCRGYKRMCFRNKPQGPMCFVEFDDVVFATQALNEHQGTSLTTSVKGGIRLSFSKNPLFIKGGHPGAPFLNGKSASASIDPSQL